MRLARVQANGGLPPVTPGKVVAIGLNYLDHIRESGVEPPSEPLVFAKFRRASSARTTRSGSRPDPKRSLAPGDVVECAIDGIGTLRNPVR